MPDWEAVYIDGSRHEGKFSEIDASRLSYIGVGKVQVNWEEGMVPLPLFWRVRKLVGEEKEVRVCSFGYEKDGKRTIINIGEIE